MRVFLTGATGFIGGHALRLLLAHGHDLICLIRPGGDTAALPTHPALRLVHGEWTAPESWLAHVPGHDAVINAVGIIRETPHTSFAAVHTALRPIGTVEHAHQLVVIHQGETDEAARGEVLVAEQWVL